MSFQFGGYHHWAMPEGSEEGILYEDDLVLVALDQIILRNLPKLESEEMVVNLRVTNLLERQGHLDKDTMTHTIGPLDVHEGGAPVHVDEYFLYAGPVGKACTIEFSIDLRRKNHDQFLHGKDLLDVVTRFVEHVPGDDAPFEYGRGVNEFLVNLQSCNRVDQMCSYATTLYPAGTNGTERLLREGVHRFTKTNEHNPEPFVEMTFKIHRQFRRDEGPEGQEFAEPHPRQDPHVPPPSPHRPPSPQSTPQGPPPEIPPPPGIDPRDYPVEPYGHGTYDEFAGRQPSPRPPHGGRGRRRPSDFDRPHRQHRGRRGHGGHRR